MVEALRDAGYAVEATGREELDVSDARACARVMRGLRPRAVVDCAETWPERREQADALATACERVGALSVYVSCADVFDGGLDRPYVESDQPAPVLPFGASKLAAERAIARANPRHAIVRAAWLFGAHGASFVDDLLAEAEGRSELPVDASLRSTPTFTGHLAEAIVRLVRRPGYGVFHATNGGEGATMLQFARALFSSLGVDCRPVAAAGNGGNGGHGAMQLVLATRRSSPVRIPDWRLGLGAYVAARTERAQPAQAAEEGDESEPHEPAAASGAVSC